MAKAKKNESPKGHYILLKDGKVEVIQEEAPLGYPKLKELLDNVLLTVISRKFGPYMLDIWLDDEGLLKGDRHPIRGFSEPDGEGHVLEYITGPLLIADHDSKGNTVPLSPGMVMEIVTSHLLDSRMMNETVEGRSTPYDCGVDMYFEDKEKCPVLLYGF